MITVAIVGILGDRRPADLPRLHPQVASRPEAQAYLMAVAGRQQQFLLDSRAYAATLRHGRRSATPASVDRRLRPHAGGRRRAAADAFASRRRPKCGTDQVHERCGALTIDQTGAKTAAVTSCW